MAAQEAVLYYFEGRGRAEIIRILLCGGQIKVSGYSDTYVFIGAKYDKILIAPVLIIDKHGLRIRSLNNT